MKKIEAIKFFGKEERILEQRGWVIENRAGTIPHVSRSIIRGYAHFPSIMRST